MLNFLKTAVDEDTALVSIMHANNETGVINPVEEIGDSLKKEGSRSILTEFRQQVKSLLM